MWKPICESTHAIKRWNQPWTIANKNVIKSIDFPIKQIFWFLVTSKSHENSFELFSLKQIVCIEFILTLKMYRKRNKLVKTACDCVGVARHLSMSCCCCVCVCVCVLTLFWLYLSHSLTSKSISRLHSF